MNQTIIVPRRKLYEHLLILEDFILDIERYVLHDKSCNTIYEYSKNKEFEHLIYKIIKKTIILSNIFFTKKVIQSVEEFEKEFNIQERRNFNIVVSDFKYYITSNLKYNDQPRPYNEQIEELLNFIEFHKKWGSDKELTEKFFQLVDSYHTILIKIIEVSN